MHLFRHIRISFGVERPLPTAAAAKSFRDAYYARLELLLRRVCVSCHGSYSW